MPVGKGKKKEIVSMEKRKRYFHWTQMGPIKSVNYHRRERKDSPDISVSIDVTNRGRGLTSRWKRKKNSYNRRTRERRLLESDRKRSLNTRHVL